MDLESEYNAKFEQLCNGIPNYQYIFEVTKLCGHGQFLTILKKQSLLDLYKMVSLFYAYNFCFISSINSSSAFPLSTLYRL